MKKYTGDVSLKGNLDVLSDKPLDSRLVVLNREDLYTLNSEYAYIGMPVVCVNKLTIYILINKEKINSLEGWIEIASQSSKNNFEVMEEFEYNRLTNYLEDTLYFIYEPWTFDSKFPVVLSDSGALGTFPLILN